MKKKTEQTKPSKRDSRIDVSGGAYLTVARETPGKYTVLSYSGKVIGHDNFGFVLADCPASVNNLDYSSDSFTCFGISERVQAGDCTFTVDTLEGPTLDALRKVARGLVMASYSSQEL
jgi:hypothetical protein